MSTILSNVWSFVKSVPSKLWSLSPVGCGVLVGYLGHPIIKLGVDAVVGLVKGLLKI